MLKKQYYKNQIKRFCLLAKLAVIILNKNDNNNINQQVNEDEQIYVYFLVHIHIKKESVCMLY